MSYVVSKKEYGRTEYEIDLARFCEDLAPLLGGTVQHPDQERHNWREYIAVDGMLISASQPLYERNLNKVRVTLSVFPHDILHNDRPLTQGSWGAKYRLPEITVAPDRPLAAIAKDIKRRLIEPSRAPLAAIREYAAARAAERNSLANVCAEVERTFPGACKSQNGNDNYSATYYLNGHMTLKVYASGNVQTERLPTLPLEKVKEIARIVGEVVAS